MPATGQQTIHKPETAAVLSKAVTRAAERLDISRSLLARILGLSPATVTRLYRGDYVEQVLIRSLSWLPRHRF